MKPLSKHIQETLNSKLLKEVFVQKLIDEELDALNRVAPATKEKTRQTTSLVDSAVGENN